MTTENIVFKTILKICEKTIQAIHITYITHILKLIFEAYKNYFCNFSCIYKNGKELIKVFSCFF